MSTVPISMSLPSPAVSSPADPKPKDAAGAAKQFEALLLAQMLRSARESSDGEEDSTSETMFDIAGQQFAHMLAGNGGLGLASLITKSLTPPK